MAKHTVYRVDKVEAVLQKSKPPRLYVKACGTVTSTGWSGAELTPYMYIVPPADGIWDFGFIAEAPTGIVQPVLSPIEATATIEDPPPWVRGVRIHAAINAMETLLRVPAAGESICVKGVLTNEGVECQALRAEDNELYTLVGDLNGFKIGDKVYVAGTVSQISFCMQGTTIAVTWISGAAPKVA